MNNSPKLLANYLPVKLVNKITAKVAAPQRRPGARRPAQRADSHEQQFRGPVVPFERRTPLRRDLHGRPDDISRQRRVLVDIPVARFRFVIDCVDEEKISHDITRRANVEEVRCTFAR